MPTISEILHAETLKEKHSIILHAEGLFYKAYEHSAWLACLFLGSFMTKRKFVKKVNQDIISIGFPKTSLGKWSNGRKTIVQEGSVIICLESSESEIAMKGDYEAWKNAVNQNAEIILAERSVEEDIVEQIRSFPIESKTPIECMIFLTQLKRQITTTKKV